MPRNEEAGAVIVTKKRGGMPNDKRGPSGSSGGCSARPPPPPNAANAPLIANAPPSPRPVPPPPLTPVPLDVPQLGEVAVEQSVNVRLGRRRRRDGGRGNASGRRRGCNADICLSRTLCRGRLPGGRQLCSTATPRDLRTPRALSFCCRCCSSPTQCHVPALRDDGQCST